MSAPARIAAVARVEWLRLRRTPAAFTLLILVPLMQVLLFGYAIRPTPATVDVAIAAPTPAAARDAAAALARDPSLRVIAKLAPGEAARAVRERRATIGLEVPAMRSFANPTAPLLPIRVIVDAAEPAAVAPAIARAEAGYWRWAARTAGVEDNGPGLKVEKLYNPDLRPDWSFIPGLVGVTVMIAAIMLGAIGVARERETGSLEALLSLPVRRWEVLAGKAAPFLVVGVAQGLLVLLAGRLLFDLPARGAVWALVLLLPAYAAAHLVLGQAIAGRAASQMAAVQGAVAFYLPAMLLSGFLYPRDALPGWARAIGSAFPLTHLIKAARDCLLRGADAAAVLAAGGPILLFLAAAFVAALATGARRLD